MSDTTMPDTSRHNSRYPGLNLGPSHGRADDKAEVVVFGFWVFLMSDLITFGILFATYVSMLNPMGLDGGPGPAELFDPTSVAIQTAFLLASGLAFGRASILMKHHHDQGRVVVWILTAAALGAMFLFFEVRDLIAIAEKGGLPTRSGWLSAFWLLVGVHGLHVAGGIVWIVFAMGDFVIHGFDDTAKTRISMLAVYWHFLDIVWVAILSVVFLAGLA